MAIRSDDDDSPSGGRSNYDDNAVAVTRSSGQLAETGGRRSYIAEAVHTEQAAVFTESGMVMVFKQVRRLVHVRS